MAKIDKYASKSGIKADDKWIGTSVGEGNITKNFTAQDVADFLNSSGAIQSSALRYKYQDVLDPQDREDGTISFTNSEGARVLFEDISTIKFSELTLSGMSVNLLYNEPFKDSYILIANAEDLEEWAIYAWGESVEDIDEPSFFDIPLTLIDSNGGLDADNDYIVCLLDYKAALVVPADTTFDPNIPDNIISINGASGIDPGTSVGDLRGDEHTLLFQKMIFPVVDASETRAKKATITHNGPSGNLEVGTPISFDLFAVLDKGEITNGDQVTTLDLVGDATQYDFSGPGVSSSGPSDTTPVSTIMAIGPMSWQVIISHLIGVDPYLNSYDLPYTDTALNARRAAGTVTDGSSSPTLTGKYFRFYGPRNTPVIDSASARSLPVSELDNGNVFTLNTGTTENKMQLMIPPGRTLVSVVDLDALNQDITTAYTVIGNISVLDNGGTGPGSHSYEYREATAGPYPSNHRHEVTLS